MSNTIIGRVLATEKNPTTIDDFTFFYELENNPLVVPTALLKILHI